MPSFLKGAASPVEVYTCESKPPFSERREGGERDGVVITTYYYTYMYNVMFLKEE